MMNRKKPKTDTIPGLLLTLLLLVLAGVLSAFLFRLGLLPPTYLLLAVLLLLTLILLCGVLLRHTKKRSRFTVGLVLTFLTAAVLSGGILFLSHTQSALRGILGRQVETTQMGVYVRADDPAASLADLGSYAFGTLENTDREKEDQVLSQAGDAAGTTPSVTYYQTLAALAQAMTDKSVGAMVLNEAYLDMLGEMEGYETFPAQVRLVDSVSMQSALAQQTGAAGGDVYTVYISGIDTRGDLTASSRSDVNIIATINGKTKQVLLVSTPRDYFVPLSISNGVPDKLTHAGLYGIDVCMDTLGMLYDIEIPYYFRVNFAGFVKIIDALGGITVYSDYEFDSQNILGYHFVQGENQMDGEAALVFSRERFSFAEGDRQRGKNQMAVIRGIVKKLASLDFLRNYGAVMSSLDGCFGTNITSAEIADVLKSQILTSAGGWQVVSYSVDGTGDSQVPYSMSQQAYVMIPDQATVEKAKNLMAKVRNGDRISQEEADA